jgi:hypothetical protein
MSKGEFEIGNAASSRNGGAWDSGKQSIQLNLQTERMNSQLSSPQNHRTSIQTNRNPLGTTPNMSKSNLSVDSPLHESGIERQLDNLRENWQSVMKLHVPYVKVKMPNQTNLTDNSCEALDSRRSQANNRREVKTQKMSLYDASCICRSPKKAVTHVHFHRLNNPDFKKTGSNSNFPEIEK